MWERKEVKGGCGGREEILAGVPTLCKSRFDTRAQKHWRWLEIRCWLDLTFLLIWSRVHREQRAVYIYSTNKKMHMHKDVVLQSQRLPFLTMKQKPITNKRKQQLKQPPTRKRSPLPSGSLTQRHTDTRTHICQGRRCSLHLKARKSKAVCIHGRCAEEEGWLASCAHRTAQPPGSWRQPHKPRLHQ